MNDSPTHALRGFSTRIAEMADELESDAFPSDPANRAYGVRQRTADRIARAIDRHYRASVDAQKVTAAVYVSGEFVAALANAAVVVGSAESLLARTMGGASANGAASVVDWSSLVEVSAAEGSAPAFSAGLRLYTVCITASVPRPTNRTTAPTRPSIERLRGKRRTESGSVMALPG